MFIAFALLSMLALLSVVVIVFKKGAYSLVKEPLAVFVTIYLFSYFVVPAYSYGFEYSRYELIYEDASYFLMVAYSSCFLIFIFFAYAAMSLGIKNNNGEVRRAASLRAFYLVGALLLILCATAFFEFFKIIASSGINSFLANRIILTAGLGYYKLMLFFPLMWVIVYSLEVFFIKKRKFEWGGYFKGAILVLIASSPLVVLGSRSNLLVGIMIYSLSIMVWMVKAKMFHDYRKVAYKFVISAVVLVFIGGALGGVRQQLMTSDESGSGAIGLVNKKIPMESVVSAFSSYENLNWFFSNEGRYSFKYGATYLSVLLGPVPRLLWEDKPTGGGPVMKNFIAPNSYDLIQGDKISSYTTGAPAEAYMNFGWLGVVIGGAIMAMIIFFIKIIIEKSSTSLGVVVASTLILRSAGFVNAEFYGVMIQFFLVGVFYVLCLPAFKRMHRF